jgi:hypothetical protein
MSNIVTIQVTDMHRNRVQQRLEELQAVDLKSPGRPVSTMLEAADSLLTLGWMLSRLPESERTPIVARANDLIRERGKQT